MRLGTRLVPLGLLACLPGCLTPLLWEDHGRQTWRERVHGEDLHVTRAATTDSGEEGELVLAYRAPRALPAPWSSELGEAGWLTLAPGGSTTALELLRGRADLSVGRASVTLAAQVPDPLGVGKRAEVVLEGSLRAGGARRLSAAEAEMASAAADAGSFDPPPALAACIGAAEATPPWLLTAAAGVSLARPGQLRVAGWVDRDLLPLLPERAGLPPAADDPARHIDALSRIQLLLHGWDARGEDMHLLLPADLAFLLRHVEFRLQPVPHFVHRSRWQLATPLRVPEELRPLPVPVTLRATTRVREHTSGGGFWDTAWRVLLTPFTAAADAAIGLGLGAGAVGLAWGSSGDC